MRVRYQCNSADYNEALSTRESTTLRHRMLRAILAGVLIILVSAVGANLGFRQGAIGVAIVLFFLLFWLIYTFAAFPLWVRRDYRRHPNVQREQSLRVDEEGLFLESEIGHTETRWAAYTRWRETKSLFLLYLGPRPFEIIPKRAFSPQQLQEFQRLLSAKLPENVNT